MTNIAKGIYRHYKGGMYRVLGTAYLESSLEPLVVYEMLYDSPGFEKGTWWVRPLSVFTETVTTDAGEAMTRFNLVEEHNE